MKQNMTTRNFVNVPLACDNNWVTHLFLFEGYFFLSFLTLDYGTLYMYLMKCINLYSQRHLYNAIDVTSKLRTHSRTSLFGMSVILQILFIFSVLVVLLTDKCIAVICQKIMYTI